MNMTADPPPWMEFAALLLWRAAPGGAWVWAGAQWSVYTGLTSDQSLRKGWLAALHPDDRAPTLEAFAAVRPQNAFECDHRIRHAGGAYRWHRTRAAFTGEWCGVSLDIDDVRRGRDDYVLELVESRRRMRNTLGIVRSIARRTAETSATVESFAMHFEGRLDALARVEGRIARGGRPGVPLESLAAEEVAAFLAREDDGRLVIAGPPLFVRPEAAETLTLMFHELGANAIKFGALSPLGGRLEIAWVVEASQILRISWRERGVPLRGAPSPDGFGAEFIKRALAYRLRARADFSLRPDGVDCTVEIPLDAVAA